MQVDARIRIRFKTTTENGRQRAIIGEIYGCPLFIDGEAFDCRLYLEGKTLELGETYEIGVKFLNPQWALPLLAVGKQISLWKGKEIALGEVMRINNEKNNGSMRIITNPSLTRWMTAWIMLAVLLMGAMNWAKTASTANSFLAAESLTTHMRNPLALLKKSNFAQKGTSDVSVGVKGETAGMTAAKGTNPVVIDLFGGKTSQIPGVINVDIIAEQGVRASASKLPFASGSVDQIVASNPYIPGGSGMMDFLPSAAETLKPGGQIIINATQRNPFGVLPSAQTLESLGLRVVQENGPLLPQFENNVFHFTDGGLIPNGTVRTTILEKIKWCLIREGVSIRYFLQRVYLVKRALMVRGF